MKNFKRKTTALTLMAFASFVLAGIGNERSALAQTSVKIPLSAAMVSRISPTNEGDPTRLVDEQTLSGDPLNNKPQAGQPLSNWTPDYAGKKLTALIDLKSNYLITYVCLYDANGGLAATDGTYKISAGQGTALTLLVSTNLDRYLDWRCFDVTAKNVTALYLTVENPVGYVGMPELVVYGKASGTNPPALPTNTAPALAAVANLTMNERESKQIAFSATDAEFDAIQFAVTPSLSFAQPPRPW